MKLKLMKRPSGVEEEEEAIATLIKLQIGPLRKRMCVVKHYGWEMGVNRDLRLDMRGS